MPTPARKEVPPPPASVDTLHTQGGCAASPVALHAVAGEQGWRRVGVPPGQKKRRGQAVAFAGEEEPSGQ